MLAALQERLQHEPDTELRLAAAEQAKITELRLKKLLDRLSGLRRIARIADMPRSSSHGKLHAFLDRNEHDFDPHTRHVQRNARERRCRLSRNTEH